MKPILALLAAVLFAQTVAAEQADWRIDNDHSADVELEAVMHYPTGSLQVGASFWVEATVWTNHGHYDQVTLSLEGSSGCALVENVTQATGSYATRAFRFELTAPTCTWNIKAQAKEAANPMENTTAFLAGSVSGLVVHDMGASDRGLAAFWVPLLFWTGLFALGFWRTYTSKFGPIWIMPTIVALLAGLAVLLPGQLQDYALVGALGFWALWMMIVYFVGGFGFFGRNKDK